ncbi:MAG: DUF4276 family protein [Betaproteobacteria bacterium]|nr:DUF4276 family protein [Betaproteobacteria bacterium]
MRQPQRRFRRLQDGDEDRQAGRIPDAWEHLANRDRWVRPQDAEDDRAQLMVQCMETWCVADHQALRTFFGQGLNERALPPLVDLEARPKDDVQAALDNATRDCERDRAYRKGRRSFELLAALDPAELEKHLPHFVRLCDCLRGRL